MDVTTNLVVEDSDMVLVPCTGHLEIYMRLHMKSTKVMLGFAAESCP